MAKKTKGSFLDTDIILKIGSYSGENLLKKILCSFGYNLYIHEYLIEEELMSGNKALLQLKDMISANEVIVMKVCDLTKDELREYNSTTTLLANEMDVDLGKKRDHNAGEVKSMAMAFTKGFEYFISDDGDARVVAKKTLQKLDGSYLQTIRMEDIVLHIRKNKEILGIERKIAKRLYLYGTNPKLGRNQNEVKKLEKIRESLQIKFDEKLWPVE